MKLLIDRISNWMAGAASVFLLGLMLITFADVVGRYFFDAPLVFTVEIVELGMGLMIFFGLALTTLQRGHIAVDLITGITPKNLHVLLVSFATLVTVIFMGLVTWRLWDRAENFWSDGLATQILFLPVAPVVFLMAIAGGVTTVFAVYLLFHPSLFSGDD
ncbi:MAG: TRAP transporter small permease [Hyphomicrobiales bacterium]|nr:TRAP transporter small permease [Hyphomicrobiales bacterium]